MKYITNFFGVGCVALLAMLIVAPGAFAQAPTEPDPPTDLMVVPGDPTETNAQQGRFTLTWSPVTGDANGGFPVGLTLADYQIEISADYDATDPTAATWAVVPAAQFSSFIAAAPDADPAVPKFSVVHTLPEESDGDAETASYNLTRYYRISATNIIGTGDPSGVTDESTATTHNVPNAPTDLMVEAGDPAEDNTQQGRITITWSPVTGDDADGNPNNGGLDVANTGGLASDATTSGYILEFFDTTADPQAWAAITSGITNANPEGDPAVPKFTAVHDLSSLTEPPGGTAGAGITRMYRVRAVNAAGQGEDSDEKTGTTHDVPDAPTGLTTGMVAVNAGDDTANDIPVSWNAVPDANNGGLPITGYELQFLLDPPGTTWATATGGTNTVLVVGGKVDTTHAGLAENTASPPVYETYYYRVRAISAAGNGDWSATSTGVKLAPPGTPANFDVIAVDGEESIDLFWDAPENGGEPALMSYTVERMSSVPNPDDPANPTVVDWADLATGYTSTTYRDRGLTAGGTYTYRVSAVNVVGTGAATAEEGAISSNKAEMPTDLSADLGEDDNGATIITLSWNGPAENGGSPITHYKIEFDDGSGAGWTSVPTDEGEPGVLVTELIRQGAQKDFEYIHSDLTSGATYTYQVSAINDAGASDPSASSTPVATDAVVPSAIADLAAEPAAAAASIDLTWTVLDDGGSAITGHDIQVSEDYDATDAAAATWMDLTIQVTGTPDATTDPPTTMYSASHTGLDPGTEYHYRVRANNSAVDATADPPVVAEWSNIASRSTHDVPEAIDDLTATADGANVDLTWTAPADGGSEITGHTIEVSTDYDDTVDPATGTWAPLDIDITAPDPSATPPTTTYSASHTGLDPGVTYHYRVSASNGLGTGDPSNVDDATTSVAVPDAITDLTATPATGGIDLAWTAPNDRGFAITGYTIEVSDDAEATWTELEANRPNADYSDTGLNPGVTRHYRVSAVNSIGTGAVSNVAYATTHNVPDAVADLAATADATSINLSWTAPADGGSAITGYTIEVSEDYDDTVDPPTGAWTALDIDITDPDPSATPPTTMYSASHTGLDPGTTRHYRVIATNGAGAGAPSNVDGATTHNVPDAITDLTATPAGSSIDLAWTAPNDNGFAITGYKIEVSDDAEATWTELEANHQEAGYSHTGPTSGTMYYYRVSAINVAGTGNPSNVASATSVSATRFAVADDGGSSGNCTDAANPCTLEAALGAGGAGDLVLMRIRRAGETASVGDATTIDKMVTLGVYVRGASAPAKGAVSFTGSVKLADGGNLMTHKDASVYFDEIEIAGMSSIDKLTVGDDLMISEEDDPDNAMTSVLAVDELTVSSGQTLTVGGGANVRVRLTKGAVGKMNGKFDVKGTVDGGGGLWIAHTSDERAASGFTLHQPGDYLPNEAIAPSRVKFTVDDCLMVTGGGTVENDLYFVAAGNVCVGLGETGNLIAVGSVDGDDITTDIIFRNDVTVNGDVMQWNDARVLFENDAMIEGGVALDYGDAGVGAYFGTPNSDPDDFERMTGSGVEFAGASNTIEGDLDLAFDGESGSTQVFLNVPMSGGYHMSTVEGDLIIEDGGEIRLHGHPGVRTDRNNNFRAHNLSVEGDVFAYADAEIMMEHAAVSSIVGEGLLCRAPGLKHGTKVILGGDVVFTAGATLTIPTVVIADDVEVEEEGTLVAATVHVTEDGELDSEESVEITDALVLQGDGLEGSLASGSTVNNLTYATVDSDEVELGATVTRLSVNVGADKELRISEAVTVTNLGLCSGTLVLIDTDSDTKTLTVTDLLTVDDGHLGLDSNRPGSAGTDIPKGNENRTADHSYILKYVTGGERMADLEWFGGANAPRKVAVDHADAVIIVNEAKSLAEGVHLFKGHLHMKGEDSHLTIGPSGLYDANPAGGPFLVVDNAELHSNGNNVQVHGIVVVATGDKQAGKIVTGGGELHVLGMTSSKNLDNASAVATVGGDGNDGGVGMIDVGAGVLQLGPETMNPKDGLHGDWQYPIAADARPHVKLDVNAKGSVMGMIRVPSGSKQTEVIGVNFGAIVFDGTKTPNKNTVNAGNPENWDGTLYVIDADKNVTVDSLGASNGAVEFRGTKATVNKDVAASSVAIYQELKTLDFKGDLAISGSGGFSSRGGAADNRHSVMIGGDYSQETTQKGGINMHDPMGGSYLSPNTDKTVMGSFMTSGEGHATRYSTQSGTSLTVKGDFDFGLTAAGYMLNADLEFSGKEAQTVGSAVDLGDVLVNNSAGLVLSDSVSQGASSMLTLTNGVISSDMYGTWMVKNTGIEEDVRGRNNALTTCDDDENCASVITGGSRRAHMTVGVSRNVMKGNSGAGEMSGGYVFPVGGMSGDRAHYRPLILQLEDDLSEAMPVTVTPMMGSDDAGDINILVPLQGGSLTLDAYADMFWKVETKEVPDLNPHIRIAASGLANVFDDSRLRMVQWDCDWSNARLAGMQIVGTDNASFAENGYVNGVLNLTQRSVEVGTCAILGVAANGIENPIHMDPLTGGIARIQFIHNLPLPFPVDLFLDGVKLMGGLNFQSATGYGHYAAGDHLITVMPVVPPGVVAPPIEIPLPSLVNEQNYAVIAHGSVANPSVKILHTKLRSSVDNMVEAILVHGSGDLGEVDVRILDPADNMTPTKMLANNFSFDSATRYISLAPGAHNVQVTSPDNRTEVEVYYVDLNGYQGETLILNLSGGMDDLGFMGVRNNGDVFLSQVVTGVEEEGNPEIPTEFALHGNYPNPFNPSTRIEFDLPESAQVSLQIVDMLGRQVMTLPAQQVEAGANRTLELNATNLASGHYLYRIIATGVDSRYVKTGRMTLVK